MVYFALRMGISKNTFMMKMMTAITCFLLFLQVLTPAMAEASTDGSPGVSNSEVIQEETSKVLPDLSNGRIIHHLMCSFASTASNRH